MIFFIVKVSFSPDSLMGHLIVSQGITAHSRIGNSLVLLKNLYIWHQRTGHSFSFPFQDLKFPLYSSQLTTGKTELSICQALLASSLPHFVRLAMVEWEQAHSKSPYEFPDGELIVSHSNILATPIAFNYSDTPSHQKIIDDILQASDTLVVHEPYPWTQADISNDELVMAYKYLLPSALMQQRVDKWLSKANIQPRHFVAVHARLGDYEHFSQGKYFFSPDFYISICRYLISVFNMPLVLFTDQPDRFTVPDNICIVDLEGDDSQFSLMQNSYLVVGPPSTFSGQAVAIGRQANDVSSLPHYIQILDEGLESIESQCLRIINID